MGLNHSDERLQEVLKRCALNTLKDDIDRQRFLSPVKTHVSPSYLYRIGRVGKSDYIQVSHKVTYKNNINKNSIHLINTPK